MVIILVSEPFCRFKTLKTHAGKNNLFESLGYYHSCNFLPFLSFISQFLPTVLIPGGSFLPAFSQDGLGDGGRNNRKSSGTSTLKDFFLTHATWPFQISEGLKSSLPTSVPSFSPQKSCASEVGSSPFFSKEKVSFSEKMPTLKKRRKSSHH